MSDPVRRFKLNAWGQEINVDLYMWTRMNGEVESPELGFEAVRLTPEGKTECYITGYEGVVSYDYNSEIQPQEFLENMERSRNITKNQFVPPPKPPIEGPSYG